MSRTRTLTRFLLLALLGLTVFAARQAPASALSSGVVISQVYGGGGSTSTSPTPTYTHDFVELFNRGATSVDLTGWSIQYTSATGAGNFGSTTTQITPLSGTLAPGKYLLIEGGTATGATGSPLPVVADTVSYTHLTLPTNREV